jgi:serine phosphatase RsbU (regulator of sigma subunit)
MAGPSALPDALPRLTILDRHLKRHGSLLRVEDMAPLRLLSVAVDDLCRELSDAGVDIVGLLATTRRTVGLILLSGTSTQTRVLEHDEEDLLRSLFHQASLVLETSLLLEERTEQAELERELKIASTIQAALLPERLREVPGWERTAVCLPAREVGGDFYTELPCATAAGSALAYGDVAGKSISGALMMMASHEILNAIALGASEVEELLRLANERLYAIRDRSGAQQGGRFVALGYLGFPESSGTLHYALAGQPPPLVATPGGAVEALALPEHRVPLGSFAFGGHTLMSRELDPGSIVVAYSDGVIEAQDPDGEAFGEHRLREVIASNNGRTAQATLDAIVSALRRFTEGAPSYDDVTLVVARWVG